MIPRVLGVQGVLPVPWPRALASDNKPALHQVCYTKPPRLSSSQGHGLFASSSLGPFLHHNGVISRSSTEHLALELNMAGQNLGALTTTAPLSSSCVDELDVVYKVNTTPDGYYYLLNGPLEPASCYPSAYAGVTTQYYSPAVACPSGFTAACGSVNAIGTISETRYTCCPT